MLVDSGSSHNFVSDRVARLLHLPVTSTEKFNVNIADGGQFSCQEKHEAIRLDIQGFSFAVTLFSLPLQGLDVVLVIQWLVELGSVLCDWRNLTMRFNWRGESRELHGQKDSSSSTEITVQFLEKEIEDGGALFVVVVKEIKDIEGGDAQPGKENSAADSLSGESGSPTLWAISKPQFTVWGEMKRATFKSL
ncbi:hypothetical protein F0562_022387 [Nyssa sinensis]|uniref:Uncharacterized protein n=1 Tax=Nyssa sinensis TaxID=561372 RepID=A0A5J5BMG1_9ASTE|nr:hypothetical protein F0562_022387 [Nyssa sinensis]